MSAYSTYHDDELVALLKQGDHGAFTEIYERYAPKLYYQINQLLRDGDASQDLVQDIFIAIWNKAHNIKAGANFAGYLYVAAQNSAIKFMRKGHLHIDYLDSLAELEENLSEEYGKDYDVEVLYELIEKEISNLPAKMKAIFELSRQGNLSYKDIAEQLDIAENTVRKQVSNALKIIRGNVHKYGTSGLIMIALMRN
ncbi:RNA polymerase sigma-70 factor (ECF subfamily) [Pedobacter sp. AK017]|uniref:RNA polymerase sigma factor n=1 Tax=Pedobacter sp. AK017 TaxID=2723073 RepID=UPI0016194B33|nr:RNA polymerase sigma-70 factor [Pedobacter sp. AK017]MBB5437287.1 RNA polymerase sigma-70 factor (ECF subfamily) [Pedobacter sp. AK017]